LNRRDFLRGSLTLAGLGACGCLPSRQPPQLKGSRRDPDYQQGHRLREHDLPDKVTSTQRCDGVILGGGVSGLSAGWRWSHAGFDNYRLLELEGEVGGNSRALHYPPTAAPIGAHYLPLPNVEARAVRRLLREMGVLTDNGIDGRHLCHSRQERLFYQGRWHDGLVPESVLPEESLSQFRSFREDIEKWATRRDNQGRKVFALPVSYSSSNEEFLALDRVSFAHYIREQGWNDPVLLWYLNYACRDDFGGAVENCSAWAGLHYFASRDGGGLGDPSDILVWPEGNQRLVSFLRKQQLGEVKTGALVLRLEETKEGVQVDYLDTATNERHRLLSKAVVSCLPSFMRGYILNDTAPTDAFTYPPWVTANLLLNRTPQDYEAPGNIAWDNVIYESPSLGYVVATHQNLSTDPTLGTVWTWYRPFPDEDPNLIRKRLLDSTWSGWADTVLAELELYHSDIRQQCQQLDVTVLGHGMVRPSVGFMWGKPLARARDSQGRVFFGHGDLSGMSLFEESQFRGVGAAEAALGSLGIAHQSFL
jgi:putative NAD(P)-binding protein